VSNDSAGSPERAHRARKRFGQNFLVRDDVIHAIVQAVNPLPGDALIEIGPGLGALTTPLASAADELHVIEIDRDLAARLRARGDARLHIHEADVLKVDFAELIPAHTSLRLVGNLPYNISTPLLLKVADIHPLIKDIHVMLQLEVVNRLTAVSGTRAFGRLSVIMQSVFFIEQILSVPPEAFNPPPKVQSAVARLKPRDNAPSPQQLHQLAQATRIAFSNKRKTLRNNFKHTLSAQQLEELGIDPGARAETLPLDAFHRLAGAIVL